MISTDDIAAAEPELEQQSVVSRAGLQSPAGSARLHCLRQRIISALSCQPEQQSAGMSAEQALRSKAPQLQKALRSKWRSEPNSPQVRKANGRSSGLNGSVCWMVVTQKVLTVCVKQAE